MSNYKKFLIQQQTYDGKRYTDVGSVVDTYARWHVVCQEFPFKVLPEAKDLPKREWYDEDGDDIYIPEDGLRFKAYDLEAKFLYSYDGHAAYAAAGSPTDYQTWILQQMANDLKGFLEFVYGRNESGSPILKIFDEYTNVGRRGITVLSHSNDLFFANDVSIDAIAQFKVKFRVNDPVTEVTLSV